MMKAKFTGEIAFIPAIIGATICLFFIRGGFLALFFILPLGFIGFGWGPKTLWAALGFAILGNCIISFGLSLAAGISAGSMFLDMLYFATMTAAFAWIIFPFDEKSAAIPGYQRLAIGSLAGTLVFIALFFRTVNNEYFYQEISRQIEIIFSLYGASGSADAQNAVMDPALIERIYELMQNVIVRGGALFSSIMIFFMNRQLSIFLIRIFGGPRHKKVFVNFHASQKLIWLMSAAGVLIPIVSLFSWTAFGIILWNIITLCALMYLAQGLGIIMFFASKPNFPQFLKYVLPVAFVFLLFRPGINMVLLGGIILLGIVENWVSFRMLNIQNNGPPSTPDGI